MRSERLAESNDEALAALLAEVETENDAVRAMLDEICRTGCQPVQSEDDCGTGCQPVPQDLDVPEAFQVVVECRDERQQREVYERLTGEGFECRLLML